MKKVFKSIKRARGFEFRAYAAVTVALMMLSSTDANADGIGQLATTAASNVNGLGTLVKAVAMFGGIGLVVMGLFKIVEANKRHESIMPGVVMLLVGGAMASVVALLSSSSATFFGSDKSELNSIGVN